VQENHEFTAILAKRCRRRSPWGEIWPRSTFFPLESTTCRDLPRPGTRSCALARRGLNGFNNLRRIPNFGAVWVKPGQRLLTANGINGVKFCCRPIGSRAMARASVQSPYSAPVRGQGGIGQALTAGAVLGHVCVRATGFNRRGRLPADRAGGAKNENGA